MPDYSYLPITNSGGSSSGSSGGSSGVDYSSLPTVDRAAEGLDESYLGRLKNNLVAAADGASLGIGDEGAALVRSLIGDKLESFGVAPYQNYESELKAIRGTMKQYAEVHPYQSLASSMMGGAASAPTSLGIKSIATAAPSLANATKTAALAGALGGAGYGFGSGEGGLANRAMGSAIGGGLGAAGGAIIAPIAYGAGRAATSPAARRLYSMLGDGAGTLDNETGAIMTRAAGGATPEAPPKEYAYLARRMAGLPEEELEQGRNTLMSAVMDDSPMFLPETVKSPSLTRLARFLNGNESSMDVMGNAIDARKSGALDRVTGILDELSPEQSPAVAGEAVQGRIKDIQKTLEAERSAAATPLYDALRESGPFKSKAVKSIVRDNDRVQDAIKQVRKAFPEYKDKPDTHFDIMDKTKQWLYGEAQATKNKAEKRFITKTLDQVTKAMDGEKPEYKAARKVYEEGSTPITELFGDKGKPMVDLLKRKPEEVGKAMLGLDYTKRLPELVKAVGPEGEQAIRDATRAALQGKVELKRETANLVADIVQVPAMRKKIKIAIGDDEKFDRLMKLLDREDLYGKANNNYHPGSSTKGNFEEAEAFQKGVSGLANAVRSVRHPFAAVEDFISKRSIPEETARKLAEVMTQPGKGLDFYETMMPLILKTQQSMKAGNVVGSGAGSIAGTTLPHLRDK